MFGDLVEDVSEDCVDDDTSIYVKNVVKALQLGSGEVLLAVAWVTEEGRMYHEMFPGVLGLDVKYGTNNERRPLLRFVGRTGNNRNMTVMNCYMPSEQQYAYAWAVNTALKHCLDEDALSQTSIIPSESLSFFPPPPPLFSSHRPPRARFAPSPSLPNPAHEPRNLGT